MKRTDKLDKVLREWAAEAAPDPTARHRLQARIREGLRETAVPRAVREGASPRTSQGALTAWRLATTTAVVAVVAGLALFLAGPPAPRQAGPCVGVGQEGMAGDSLVLFEEVSRLFEDQLRWAVETGSGLHLNMDADALGEGGGGAPWLVDIVVLREDEASGAWHPLWQARALTGAEEWVHCAANGDSSSQLLLWIHRLPDGNMAVETTLALSRSKLSGTFGGVLVPGEAKAVATFRRDGRLYRVRQRVRPFQPRKEA